MGRRIDSHQFIASVSLGSNAGSFLRITTQNPGREQEIAIRAVMTLVARLPTVHAYRVTWVSIAHKQRQSSTLPNRPTIRKEPKVEIHSQNTGSHRESLVFLICGMSAIAPAVMAAPTLSWINMGRRIPNMPQMSCFASKHPIFEVATTKRVALCCIVSSYH